MRYYSSTASEKTLSSAVNTTDATITINNLTGLPASYPYTLVVDPDTASEEIMLVWGLDGGTTLKVKRGSDTYDGVAGGNGTAKQVHDAGAKVKHMITARDLQEPQDHIAASQGVHGLIGDGNQGGDVVGTNKTQTLTNKTISTANNTLNIQSSDVSGLSTLLDAKANLASPVLTGTPTAPTAADGTNNTQIATTAFVQTAANTKVAEPAGTGIVVRTGDNASIARSIAVSGTGISITNADGVNGNPTITFTGGSSTGDVTGPASSTDNNVVTFNGATGKVIKDSGIASSNLATLSGTQIISGNKTFSGTTTFTGNISANSLTITPTELGYLDGVTSNIQTQLNAISAPFWYRRTADSANISTAAATFATSPSLTANTFYHFKYLAFVYFNYTGTSGTISMNHSFSNTPQEISWMFNNANDLLTGTSTVTTSVAVSNSIAGSSGKFITVEGFFQTNATTGGTFTPQVSVSAGSVNVKKASNIQLTKLATTTASINGTWT